MLSIDDIFVVNKIPLLRNLKKTSLIKSKTEGKYIENMIGSVELPLGIAGPIKIPGFGEFTVPLATSEGALVASVNRGLKSLRLSKSLSVVVEYSGMTRGPVFEAKNLIDAKKNAHLIKKNLFSELKKIAKSTSSHIKLTKIQTQVLGKYIYVRFRFDTQEAMGMNMATFATEELSKYIKNKLNIEPSALSANFCVDKKVAYANWFFGRGYSCWVEAKLSQDIVKSVLKTTPDDMIKVYNRKIVYGSWLTGATAYNAQFANVIAAFFTATGQDLGHVGESSQGILILEIDKSDLYASIWLPNINLGTVGGGTSLPSQNEALSLILKGKEKNVKNSYAVTSALASAILAAELSLIAALSTDDLARAHKKHTGR